MGKYLEIAQKVLKEMPQDCCITEDQLLTVDSMDSAESSHCEKRELSELSPESDSDLASLCEFDWDVIRNDPVQLEAVRYTIRTAKQVASGQIPESFTETTQCKRCGPVRVRPGYPNPTNDCPWCFNRIKGLPVPTPKIVGSL